MAVNFRKKPYYTIERHLMKSILLALGLLLITSTAHAASPPQIDLNKPRAQTEEVNGKKEDNSSLSGHLMDQTMRDVVRQTLTDVTAHGLQGHCYSITFLTSYPGVKIPDYLRARYPQYMTIILQYEFYDLKVDAQTIDVTLAFNNVPQTLVIPINAVAVFSDPSTNSTLQFQVKGTTMAASSPTELISSGFSVLLSWFPMLLLIGVWIYFMRQVSKNSGKPGHEGLPHIYKKLSELVDVHKEILENLKHK